MYKAIVMDLDGTLLTSARSVLLQDIEALERAREKGCTIVLASGRSLHHMEKILRQLDYNKEGQYYIAYNGAMVLSAKDQQPLLKKTIDPETVRWFIRTARKHCEKINIHLYQTDRYYIERDHPATEIYESSGIGKAVRISDLMEIADQGILNAAFLGTGENWQKKLLSEIDLSGGFQLVPSSPLLLEYADPQVNKGSSVRWLMDRLGIPMEEVICVGDDQNDLPMIRAAGLGIAMKNAPETVQAQADLVTEKTNDEGGIAWIVERYLA